MGEGWGWERDLWVKGVGKGGIALPVGLNGLRRGLWIKGALDKEGCDMGLRG